MTAFRIDRVLRPGREVTDLIERHFALMRSQSPEDSCHVMDAGALFASGAQVFAVRDGDATLGMGALKPLDATHAELKSMHTRSETRGRGVGHALVLHLLETARAMGVTRVSLETGSQDPFAAARRLYGRHGFGYCDPFGDYRPDPMSVFMTRAL